MKTKRQGRVPSCRPFTLLDATLAVAATATSFYVLRKHHLDLAAIGGYSVRGEQLGLRPWSVPEWLIVHSSFWMGWTFCWLIPYTWLFLFIRLRRPRPRLRRLFQQPGMAATTTTTFFTVITGSMYAISEYALNSPSSSLLSMPSLSYVTGYRLEKLAADGGIMVLSAWTILALTGRCRREWGWIDTIGIVLGGCWIVAWIIHYAHICWNWAF